MNMRKIIAVLAAVLMLCAIIPMGAMVSAAPIFSANFDYGEVVFAVNEADTAVIEDGVLHWTTAGWKNLYKSFNGVAGTEYVLSVKAKASAAVDLKFVFHNGSWSGYVAPDFVPTLSTEWATYTYHFTPTEKGIVLLLQAKAAAEIWLDDIKVSEYIAPVDPDVPDDAIYFENFEEDHTWASGNANATMEIIPAGDAPVTKAENGNYVVKHTIPESVYPYISDRTGISVQPNTDYIISFDALNSVANWPIQVIVAENYWLGGAFVTSLSQQIKPSATAWETYSFVFNTGDHDKIWLGAKSQWANTTVYFDNFYIAPLNGSVQNDGYLKNGNFEAGALEWLHTSNTEIVADPTGAGQGNVIKTNENAGNASGVHMFSQPATNLVAGHEYVLSFKVYGYTTAVSNAAFFVKFPSACSGFTFGGDLVGLVYSGTTTRYNVNSNLNKWMTATVTFTTSADVALIDFMNYRPNGGQYYFDDIVITPKHSWNDATCTAPKTCSTCGLTEGEALGHTPGAAADCVNAQTCTVCGAELAAALGHDWADATCTAPKTCSVCGATDGEALGHTPGAAADCVNDQTCTVCGEVLATALGHTWDDATCTAPKTCSVCGATDGDALGHTPGAAADCENAQTCTVCGAELVAALGHTWDDATCTAPKTCSVCGATEGEALGHTYAESARVEATCGADGSVTYTCGNCGDSYTETLPATGEHVVKHVSMMNADCEKAGNLEYWTCEACGSIWLDEACTEAGTLEDVTIAQKDHEALYACDQYCMYCGEKKFPRAKHSIVHVEAKEAVSCVEPGNIEYWYCEHCNTVALDESLNSLTSKKAVEISMDHTVDDACDTDCNVCGIAIEPWHVRAYNCSEVCSACGAAIEPVVPHNFTEYACSETCCYCGMANPDPDYTPEAEHTYDNEYDVDCNVCGAIREVTLPIVSGGTSVSEDVSGVAVRFDVTVSGLAVVEGTGNEADYTNATIGGDKLVSMGVIASNQWSVKDIPCVYLLDLEEDSAAYATRIINIPGEFFDSEITFQSYCIVEIDGVATTVNGEYVTASYNSASN